jgi:hypothetical protein
MVGWMDLARVRLRCNAMKLNVSFVVDCASQVVAGWSQGGGFAQRSDSHLKSGKRLRIIYNRRTF